MDTVTNLKEVMLDRLGRRIDAAWKRAQEGSSEWIEGSLELAQALGEGRGTFTADQAFGTWLKDNGHDHVNEHDRAALIGMASDLVLARDVLTKTDRRSYKHIWMDVKDRFVHVDKPRRKGTQATKPKKVQERHEKVLDLHDAGMPKPNIASEVGYKSDRMVDRVLEVNRERELGRQEAMETLLDAAAAKNFADKGALRIEDAIRIHTARLNKAYHQQVNEEVIRRIAAADDITRKQNTEMRAENLRLSQMLNQRGVFTEQQFAQLLMCVHPDNTASIDIRNEILRLLVANKNRLVKS
jgi:hypothetical protein